MYKRRGTTKLNLSIDIRGKIRLTMPAWASYQSAIRFAESRRDWLEENLPTTNPVLASGQQIGKAHQLLFAHGKAVKPASRIAGSTIRISHAAGVAAIDPAVQQVAARACMRALRLEAEALLPGRLRQLAADGGFTYSSVGVKQLTGRWGSCDARGNITLNLFLMQLPWELIDYVLWHELTHTKHLNHGPDFWQEFLQHEPRAKLYRGRIRRCKPVLMPARPARSVA